ncbi:MAG: DUF4058 family protein [Chloroflexi bacterium]|nr:DUF4058 family protein [Chloroflexota bacterium]
MTRNYSQMRETLAPYITSARDVLPIIVTVPTIEQREPFIEIVHARDNEIVTVIEVISPTNKLAGDGRAQYREKQRQMFESRVNLVEIDLLASGQPIVAIPKETLATVPEHRYLISVHRATHRYRFELYPIALPQTLPQVRVPLRDPDPDVVFDLQEIFAQCYANGGYANLIDYRRPPRAPLSAKEAAWVKRLLKSALTRRRTHPKRSGVEEQSRKHKGGDHSKN